MKKTILAISLLCPLAALAVDIVAHRGDMQAAPENTAEAVAAAVKNGADFAEFDVWQTQSGEMICLHHEVQLQQLAKCYKKIVEITPEDRAKINLASGKYAHLKTVRIPLLAEVLKAMPKNGKIVFDSKNARTPDYFKKAAAAFDEAGFDKSNAMFYTYDARETKKYFPNSKCILFLLPKQEGEKFLQANRWFCDTTPKNLYTLTPLDTKAFAKSAKSRGFDAVGIMETYVDPNSKAFAGLCADLKREGLYVMVWTVNDPARAKAFAKVADSITTDELYKILEAFGRKRP